MIVGVRLVFGARVVTPTENLEALGLEAPAQRPLARLHRLRPADDLELHWTPSLAFAEILGNS